MPTVGQSAIHAHCHHDLSKTIEGNHNSQKAAWGEVYSVHSPHILTWIKSAAGPALPLLWPLKDCCYHMVCTISSPEKYSELVSQGWCVAPWEEDFGTRSSSKHTTPSPLCKHSPKRRCWPILVLGMTTGLGLFHRHTISYKPDGFSFLNDC